MLDCHTYAYSTIEEVGGTMPSSELWTQAQSGGRKHRVRAVKGFTTADLNGQREDMGTPDRLALRKSQADAALAFSRGLSRKPTPGPRHLPPTQ
jgi:hypothetical protein